MTASNFSQPLKAYTRASHTVAKTRQVVMLYDGAIRFLQQGLEAMERGDIEQRYLKLTRVSDILMGLQTALDFEAGRDTAQLLYNFYSSLDSRILSLHRAPRKDIGEQVLRDLKAMRDVWDGIDRGEGPRASAVAFSEALQSSSPSSEEQLPSEGITFSA